MSSLPRRAWSPAEVAEQIGIERRLVVRMCQKGELDHFMAGRYYRIPTRELDRLLKEIDEPADELARRRTGRSA